jgi:hypothetical protein
LTWNSEEPATIWYFGHSYATWTALRDQLSKRHHFAPVGDIINRWARQLTEPLRNFDAAVAIDDPAAWAASGIGCRGRFETPLMSFACCFAAFLEAMEAGGRQVFVVGDEDLGWTMYDTARKRGWAVGWRAPGAAPLSDKWRGLVHQAVNAIRTRIIGLRHFARRRRHLKRLRRRYPIDREQLRRADTVLVLWGRANTFSSQDRRVRDGWFVDLPRLLSDAGRQLAYLIEPVDWGDPYEAIAVNALASGQPALMIEDAYTIADMLRAATLTYRRPARLLRFEAHGLDLTPAIDRAFARETRRGPTAAHLQAKVGDLLRRLGVTPRTVVHLYEGQPWERSFRLGIRHALPQTRVVAVQHMPFPPLFLNSMPSVREIATGGLPDSLLVLGPKIADYFRELGVPPERLAVGGAMRFQTVKELVGSSTQRRALCCVGVDWHESHELADKAAQSVARFADVHLVVNFNPLVSPEFKSAVRNFVLDRLPIDARARVEFSDLGVRDLIASTGLVLYSDTNAAYEAFAAGCELVFVGRDHALDYDKLPSGWATHCRSVDDIAAAIEQWLSRPAAADRADRLRLLSEYLADVDAAVFLERI